MAAPDESWSTITTGQVDADSPLDVTLTQALRANLIHLEQWLGDGYVAAKDHDHDGVNSKSITLNVSQSQMKSTTGTVNTSSTAGVNLTLPGGEYGFYPRVNIGAAGSTGFARIADTVTGSTAVATLIWLSMGNLGGGGITALQRYIQASPPYMLGEKKWGHFLYQLRDIASGNVISAYEAADPPWAYNGPSSHSKDSIERIACVPHPFADYYDCGLPAGTEISLIDLSDKGANVWCKGLKGKGKGLFADMGRLKLGSITPHSKYKLPTIGRFSTSVVIRKATI